MHPRIMNNDITTPIRPVTAQVIADALSVSKRHVLNLAEAGKIPALRVGHAWRFYLSEVMNVVTYKP